MGKPTSNDESIGSGCLYPFAYFGLVERLVQILYKLERVLRRTLNKRIQDWVQILVKTFWAVMGI